MTAPLELGWREWVTLPQLRIDWIKAKIDTGARTSALHASYYEAFEKAGESWLRFGVRPLQGDSTVSVTCEAPLLEWRDVTDSGGHKESRPVILTDLQLGDELRTVEVTLTDRDSMRFRMLIGRTAIKKGVNVKPGASFLLGGSSNHPPEST
jgi:hypothetical protein